MKQKVLHLTLQLKKVEKLVEVTINLLTNDCSYAILLNIPARWWNGRHARLRIW